MLAAIPYTTFPDLPFGLRTFGLMVALGVLIGARIGSDYGERFGVHREDTYRTGTLMVLAGIIGSRLTWVATHTEDIENPIDVIAIWEGGIQFAGGFIAALVVGWPMFRKWTTVQRWHVLNGYAYGLTAGVAIGRIGCYAVGEHFGRTTDFFLGTRYDGGDVREPFLGDVPLTEGTVFHNTSLYELLTMAALFAVMTLMIWRARRVGHEVLPVTLVSLFFVWAGVVRFLLDTLRVNDERFLSMTGAQWMSLVMVPYGIWLFFRTRPAVAKLVGPDGRALEADTGLLAASDADVEAEPETAPDELAPPDENGETPEPQPSEATESAEQVAEVPENGESEEPADTEPEPEPVAESSEPELTDDAAQQPESAPPAEEAEAQPDGDGESAEGAESAEVTESPPEAADTEAPAKSAPVDAEPEPADAE